MALWRYHKVARQSGTPKRHDSPQPTEYSRRLSFASRNSPKRPGPGTAGRPAQAGRTTHGPASTMHSHLRYPTGQRTTKALGTRHATWRTWRAGGGSECQLQLVEGDQMCSKFYDLARNQTALAGHSVLTASRCRRRRRPAPPLRRGGGAGDGGRRALDGDDGDDATARRRPAAGRGAAVRRRDARRVQHWWAWA